MKAQKKKKAQAKAKQIAKATLSTIQSARVLCGKWAKQRGQWGKCFIANEA